MQTRGNYIIHAKLINYSHGAEMGMGKVFKTNNYNSTQ